jgi:hypothetical protein
MLKNRYFITGSDCFSVVRRKDELIRLFSDFDIEIIDGSATQITEV